MTDHRLRVLVVDDSPTARTLLVALLEDDPAISVVGEASDGMEAVRLTRALRPDVITMDVHMPTMDGLTATREIMASVPTPIVVVTANSQPGDVELSLDVTAAGALMLVEKPAGRGSPDFEPLRRHFVSMVKAMAHVKLVRRWTRAPRSSNGSAVPTERPSMRIRIIAIGASTGGPAAVFDLLKALPAGYPAPILLVQHIADGFTPGLVHWLQACGLTVKVAQHGERLRPATVYVAPDDHHLGVADERHVLLSRTDEINGFRPSVTFLYESVARVFGPGVAAVILTGMGSDGVEGLRAVRAAGGFVLAQDETSAVVYGMPREAVRAGLVHFVGDVADIARRLREMNSTEIDP